MKKLQQIIVAVVVVLAVSVSLTSVISEVDAQETTPLQSGEKTIAVTGVATNSIEPDLLSINLGIETQKVTAAESLQVNSETMNQVISALKVAGVQESEISTSSLNIRAVYERIEDGFLGIKTTELVGYKVSNIISVETSNLELAASIIDSAVESGVNRVDSVMFLISPQRQMELKDKLLEDAVENAKFKAEIALSPLDHQIIGVKSISLSEFGIIYPQPVYRMDADMDTSFAMSSPTPVFASEQDITTSAHVVFIIGSN